jgi:RNA polymerase sigma factor (sigma-70 family)
VPHAHRAERFRTLYTDNFSRIVGYALRRTGTPEDAADVAAEVFLVAWRRLDDVPDGEETRLWLYGTARRVLANHHRGARRRSALRDVLAAELRDAVAHDPPPSDTGPLRAAWQRLRPEDRDVLGLVTWEGLSTDELANVLGCSGGAAKLRLHRARRRFARLLAATDLLPAGVGDVPAKPLATSGHVLGGRVPARPGTEET